MKRFVCSLALIAALLLTLAAPACADAPEAHVPECYYALSCEADGEFYDCDGEYVALNADGTGEVMFGNAVYALEWTLADAPFTYGDDDSEYAWEFSFTDEDDDMLEGYYLPEGVIVGTYLGYDYTFITEAAYLALGSESDPESVSAAADEALPLRAYRGEEGYVILNDAGTGVWLYRGEAMRITDWSAAGESVRICANDGSVLAGTLTDDTLDCTDQSGSPLHYRRASGSGIPVTQLAPERWNSDLPLVFDEADILTDEEERTLSERAYAISETRHCNVYIITLANFLDYTDSYSLYTCDEEIRTGYDLGYGSDKSCVCLFLSMDDRDFDILCFGDFGNAAFTDYGKEKLQDVFLDNFRDNDWFGGMSDYLTKCDSMLDSAASGKPLDIGSDPSVILCGIGGSLVLSFIIALLFCLAQKRRMQAVTKQADADAYVPQGGVDITYRRDRYVRTTTTRTYSPKSSGSGGGHGGTSVGHSGHSHSGGKF